MFLKDCGTGGTTELQNSFLENICFSEHLPVAFPAGNYMFKVSNRNTRKRC